MIIPAVSECQRGCASYATPLTYYLYAMKLKLVAALFLLVISAQFHAQSACNLHIVTSPKNYMQGFPFRFTVNGRAYKLKAGQCMDLKLQADSVHILMEDHRWVKNETVDLHAKADEHLYVRIFWGWKENDKKRIRFFAEAVCKSCFDEYRANCKKEFTE